jgi:hypothetical protein
MSPSLAAASDDLGRTFQSGPDAQQGEEAPALVSEMWQLETQLNDTPAQPLRSSTIIGQKMVSNSPDYHLDRIS